MSVATFQQRFALSDDCAAQLDLGQSLSSVDCRGQTLGTFVELLLLRRAAKGGLTVLDGSLRGDMVRKLLHSGDRMSYDEGVGIYRAEPGMTDVSAASDFADAARSQLVQRGVPKPSSYQLSGALHELLGNVAEHGGDAAECLAAFEMGEREAWFVVADDGQGVVSGYRRSAISTIPTDGKEALRWAVINHRSRTGLTGRGTGFRTVINAIRSLDGVIRVRSDDASIEVEQRGEQSSFLVREQGQLKGFAVSIFLRWRHT